MVHFPRDSDIREMDSTRTLNWKADKEIRETREQGDQLRPGEKFSWGRLDLEEP